MSYYKQKDKVTFKIVPHTQNNTLSLRISKKAIKIIAIIFILSLFSLIGGLYYYYRQNQLATKSRDQLIQHKQKRYELESENQSLSKKLIDLYDIMDRFENITVENKKLRERIDFEDNSDDLSSNPTNELESNIKQVAQYGDEISSFNFSNIEDRQKLADDVGKNLESLNQALSEKEKNLSELDKEISRYNDYLASRPKGWPIENKKGRITATFGYRVHPILERRIHHNGIDIAVWYNHEILATGEGEVVYSGDRGGFGRVVIIDHGYNYKTLYAHNNRLLVNVGDEVERGDMIALSGSSGRSTGPHLHYEVHYNDSPVDPMDYAN